MYTLEIRYSGTYLSMTKTTTLGTVGARVPHSIYSLPGTKQTLETMRQNLACGFQSESYRMTVSAVWRLIPSPPALVDSMNTNLVEFG